MRHVLYSRRFTSLQQSFGVDLLCGVPNIRETSFLGVLVCLPVWLRALVWNCLLYYTVLFNLQICVDCNLLPLKKAMHLGDKRAEGSLRDTAFKDEKTAITADTTTPQTHPQMISLQPHFVQHCACFPPHFFSPVQAAPQSSTPKAPQICLCSACPVLHAAAQSEHSGTRLVFAACLAFAHSCFCPKRKGMRQALALLPSHAPDPRQGSCHSTPASSLQTCTTLNMTYGNTHLACVHHLSIEVSQDGQSDHSISKYTIHFTRLSGQSPLAPSTIV
jgi:hypothetical protein